MSHRTPTAPTRNAAARPRAARHGALLLAGLGLVGALAGCADESQSGDSFPDRQQETVPVPGEASESPS